MSKFVLDASALLAVLNNEPGADRWYDEFADSVMSTVNFSEVVGKLADAGLRESDLREVIEPLKLHVVDFDEAQAWAAGLLRMATRAAGLSLGDRACLALGRTMKLPVLTTDHVWKSLHLGVQVHLIRS